MTTTMEGDPKVTNDDEIAFIECSTTAGSFKMKLIREWSPHGYDRAVYLFQHGFYDTSHFFRTVPGFLVQFGISYTTDRALKQIADSEIPDDPKHDPPIRFDEGYISFAGSGKNSRNSQLFIAYDAHDSFGTEVWETPIGSVVQGMDHVKQFFGGYGDMPPWGNGPVQYKIHSEGRAYIEEHFPHLDRFLQCQVELSTNRKEKEKEEEMDIEKSRIEKTDIQKHHKTIQREEPVKKKNLRDKNERLKRLRRQANAAHKKVGKVFHDASLAANNRYQRAIHEVHSMAKNRTLPTSENLSSDSIFYFMLLLIILLVAFLCKKNTSKNLKKN